MNKAVVASILLLVMWFMYIVWIDFDRRRVEGGLEAVARITVDWIESSKSLINHVEKYNLGVEEHNRKIRDDEKMKIKTVQ